MKNRTKLILIIIVAFAAMNAVAFLHAYTFTHFSSPDVVRTKDPEELSVFAKAGLLFTGIDNPRPQAKEQPADAFETVYVQSSGKLQCWRIAQPGAKGTVILFHGYAGEKSSLLGRAAEFRKMGYHTLLVDFYGSGGSEGNSTSVGYTEATQVKDCFDYLADTGEQNIILFGTSMGAVAVLKAMRDDGIKPTATVLECPFGALYNTVCARFNLMHVPSFPMAGLLTFWGGVQHGYWAFAHNPADYAEEATCPTLLLFGAQDERVTVAETERIFANLPKPKTLKIYREAGHNVFIPGNQSAWVHDVEAFVGTLTPSL
ncbi:alpha/beta hydrolase [Parachryseolinea silvisoli]|uniref:alpha/beta hydrolase n=1 Tax=Parachryseolinea silvisoli TaxID=2873601 RepID=UPI0022657E8A|nr:lysophospholipase [Parachryseolinea silvisoli]MCD9016746.1 lysophospholipase [Parachryseolinea silvisoli]